MAKAIGDEKILSYNDLVLRRSDLDILSGPYFLNDRLIEFYFSYLSSCHSSEDILLVPPSIAFWIKECPDTASLKDFLEPLHLSNRKLILFPINDNDDASIAEGGSHWSLLAFEKSANAFVHHDSSSGNMNQWHAKKVYKVVCQYVSSNASYVECSSTPKQVNGYDCGVYVIAFARAICSWYMNTASKDSKKLWFTDLLQITPSVVSDLRNEVLVLIRSLMTVP
ncbi:hypothetical protein M9H77_15991 [Catharanthus roseus]|uniref:Uncharacterized protein n=1 Tax=Catharanthus roseus TaxID=4058 RepID=A0ACC0B0V6_CATRO|nr:hypothetical protein M9H77_15991 [Catharanthus roseus]